MGNFYYQYSELILKQIIDNIMSIDSELSYESDNENYKSMNMIREIVPVYHAGLNLTFSNYQQTDLHTTVKT